MAPYGQLFEYTEGKFPDLFLLCTDVEATFEKWKGYPIARLHYRYPKPHTMLAVILDVEEMKLWQVKVSGGH
jgi:hypothetical protein